MPLRDDWTSAAELVRRIDNTASAHRWKLGVLMVDDGSVQLPDPAAFQGPFAGIETIRVLRLRRNLGHQRAIAIGLAHVYKSLPCDAVVVMDADGEDTADGVVQLLNGFNGGNAIFAERSRRTESLVFRVFYTVYKILHRIFTGIGVKVGNFSILPARYLDTLVVTSELWNHYAASVFRSGLPFSTIPVPRGHRIDGKSRMNFVSLAAHGLSAISVFGDVVGVRALLAAIAGALLALIAGMAAVAIRLFTDRAIPGWTTYTVGVLAILFGQFVTLAAGFTFSMLSNRINLGFVPLRDYEYFVASEQDLYSNE